MENKLKTYLRRVSRRLNMPADVKRRVLEDYESGLRGRLEAGEPEEQVFRSPKEAARMLNEQMKEYTYRKSPWRFLFLGAAVLCAARYIPAALLWGCLAVLSLFPPSTVVHPEASVGIIGGADGPTAIFLTASPVGGLWWLLVPAAVLLICFLGYRHFSRLKR